jgi:hypothetical protein
MKKLAVRVVILAALIALGWWIWTAAFPNPRKAVWHRLQKLAETASFSANEGQFARLARARKVVNFFSEQVVVSVSAPGADPAEINGREDLLEHAQAGYVVVKGLKATFSDPNIEMTPGNEEAIVDVAFRADVSGEKDAVVEELKFGLKKIEGTWLITRVESVNTLKQ